MGMLNLAELQYFDPGIPGLRTFKHSFCQGWRLRVLPPRWSQQQQPSYSSAKEWLCGRRRAHWWCLGRRIFRLNDLSPDRWRHVSQRSTRSPRWSRCCARVLWSCRSCRSWRAHQWGRQDACRAACLPAEDCEVSKFASKAMQITVELWLWHSFPRWATGTFGGPRRLRPRVLCSSKLKLRLVLRRWSIQFQVSISDAKSWNGCSSTGGLDTLW